MSFKSLALSLILIGAMEAAPCLALPLGKAWAPTEPIDLPGFVYLGPPRLDWDGASLLLQTIPQARFGGDARGFAWSGSAWIETWRLGYPTLIFWPVIAPRQEVHLVWGGASEATAGIYMMAQVLGNELSPLDTITTHIDIGRPEYDAAVGERRRWFVVNDNIPNPAGPGWINALRIFFSDTAKTWREATISGSADYGVTIAPLDDSTAMVVWATRFEGLRWGTLSGREWIPGVMLNNVGRPIRPHLRRRPSGGYWLSWGNESPDVMLASFAAGAWSPPLRITADYAEPHSQHFAEDTDMSRDEGEYPVLAWDTQSPFSGGEVAVSFPGTNGYSLGEVVPGSGAGVLPSVARDHNGDVWIAWWEEFRRTWWTHTYTHATASNLHVEGKGRRRSLVWTLSEPAPESWWAVFASRNDAPLEQVARVQAGEDLEVRWPDTSPPAGRLRYMIRRECLDTRYRWESETISFPETRPLSPPGIDPFPLPVLKRPMTFFHDSVELSVENTAPGEVELSLYDLQGRLLLTQRGEASSGGMLRVALGAASGPLTPGIYFARIRDVAGRESNAVRFVVLH